MAALIRNSPKLEAIHMSIIWRIDKENVEQAYDRILFDSEILIKAAR